MYPLVSIKKEYQFCSNTKVACRDIRTASSHGGDSSFAGSGAKTKLVLQEIK